MSNAAGASAVQSVDRAVTVLEILARHGDRGVTDVAGELGVHKSTAFRLIAALETRGLVEQTTQRGKYRLGVGIIRLAGATSARLDVVHEARPVCRRLAAQTGESVNVSVLSDRCAMSLDQVAGASAVQPDIWVGQRLPLHASSTGKVLLSGLEDTDLDAALRWGTDSTAWDGDGLVDAVGPDGAGPDGAGRSHGQDGTPAPDAQPGRDGSALTAYTSATITSPHRLRVEVLAVRDRGYATAVDELQLGLSAVAGPIRNAHGDVVASLSVSGPTFRLTGSRLRDAVSAVRSASTEVSQRLGWTGGPT